MNSCQCTDTQWPRLYAIYNVMKQKYTMYLKKNQPMSRVQNIGHPSHQEKRTTTNTFNIMNYKFLWMTTKPTSQGKMLLPGSWGKTNKGFLVIMKIPRNNGVIGNDSHILSKRREYAQNRVLNCQNRAREVESSYKHAHKHVHSHTIKGK